MGNLARLELALWPERKPLSGPERKFATGRIARAHAEGTIDAGEASARDTEVSAATNRGELRTALRDLPGATAPAALLPVCRIITALWLVSSVVQFVVWVVVDLATGWDFPWWIWPLLGGGLLVTGLWQIVEREYLVRIQDATGACPG